MPNEKDAIDATMNRLLVKRRELEETQRQASKGIRAIDDLIRTSKDLFAFASEGRLPNADDIVFPPSNGLTSNDSRGRGAVKNATIETIHGFSSDQKFGTGDVVQVIHDRYGWDKKKLTQSVSTTLRRLNEKQQLIIKGPDGFFQKLPQSQADAAA